MDILEFYSPSYAVARRRFRELALSANARVERYPINVKGCEFGSLTIDVAIIGHPSPSLSIVLSSGLHGLEGFLGSAIQCAWLAQIASKEITPPDGNFVLIHAINPYGFTSLRRTNEDNIDLNRNFLLSDSDYLGSPDGYRLLNGFLNPPSPPSDFEPFRLKALWHIFQTGLPTLKNTVAGGQYEFSKGLFFGGYGLSQSTLTIQDNIERWIADAHNIIHIDFHSGLGQYAEYKLLLIESKNSSEIGWYHETFGEKYVECLANAEGTAYRAFGTMGEWIAQKLSGRNYRFVAAEFGTYSIVRVLGALRAENRVHFFCSSSDARYKSAKAELLECFCPSDNRWRKTVLERGLSVINQAMGADS